MSEYQYYEFMAIDRPLSRSQIAEVRKFSTRAEITATSFVNEYHFGDFRGSPELLVSKYFDVMLYYANWGTHRLLMNVPPAEEQLKAYCAGEVLKLHHKNGRVLLDFTSNTEDYDWEDADSWSMATLSRVRAEISEGDLRPLFLGWLAGVETYEEEHRGVVPPIPDGLSSLTPAQKKLAEFLRVDEDLLAAAAMHSKPATAPAIPLPAWIAQLTGDEKDRFIEAVLAETSPTAIAQLRRRYQIESKPAMSGDATKKLGISQLISEMTTARGQRKAAEREQKTRETERRAAKAAAAREERINQLMRDEGSAWKSVETIVVNKQAAEYVNAVKTLGDLKEVALRREALNDFAKRVRELRDAHRTKRKFIDTLKASKLLEA
jgi:hypothetical protein